MDDAVQTLNNLIPVLAIGGLALFMTLERWLPYFEHGADRGRQRWHNLGVVAVTFVVNAALAGFLVLPVMWADAHRFGLMYRLNVPGPAAMTAGVFLIDLWNYA